MKIIKKDLRFEESLKKRLEFICEFSNVTLAQFLYRTVAKAMFNVKDNIKDIIKNSITLIINITTLPTKIRKDWWQNHICLLSFC